MNIMNRSRVTFFLLALLLTCSLRGDNAPRPTVSYSNDFTKAEFDTGDVLL